MEDYIVTIQSDGSYGDLNNWKFPEGLIPMTNTESGTGKVTFRMPKNAVAISAEYGNTLVYAIDSITADHEIYNNTISICEGEEVQLTANVSPTWAHNKKMKWTSANSGSVEVDENGLVKGITDGSQILVTATTTDGSNKTKSIYITVHPHADVDYEDKTVIQHGDCI